jgi:tRNA 2-thiouridine synthesizing protein D
MASGHSVPRVFFYHEGVFNGRQGHAEASANELQAGWQRLVKNFGTDLVLCVAAAERRGVMDQLMAEEGQGQANLAPGFRIAGLGQWMEAVCEAGRVVRFGSGQV